MTHTFPLSLIASASVLLLFATCSGRNGAPPTEAAQAKAFVPVIDLHGPPQLAEYVVDCFLDSQGDLWFGTMGHGVAHYHGDSLTFLSPANGKGGNVVSSIAEDNKGNMWFAGHEGTGLCHYNGTTFNQLWIAESSVRADHEGNIWASKSGNVFRHDGRTLVPFAMPFDRDTITIYAIHPGHAAFKLKDSKGNWWFGTDGAGAYKYDGTTFTHFTKQDGLCSNTVNDIVEDDRGRIWFICMQAYQPEMTGDGGLCVWDGEAFTAFIDVEGLHHNDLYTLFKDRSGHLWIGATGVGVYRYDCTVFTLFDRTDRPDLNGSFGLQGMAEDANGTLWCGFSGGLFRFDDSTFVNVTRSVPWD